MQLPKEATSRADAARAQIAAMNANVAPRSEEPAPVADASASTIPEPVVLPPVVEDQVATPASALTAPAVEQAPVEAPSVEKGRDKVDPEDWKGRYDLLRASRDTKRAALQETVTRLEKENAELRRGQAESAPAAKETPTRFELGEEDKKYLGDTEAEVIARVAKHSDERIDRLEAESRAREAQRSEQMFEELDTLAPTWRDLDEDRGFNAWLDSAEEVTGVVRREALNRFLGDFNASAVARLIGAYTASTGAAEGGQRAPEPAAPLASPEPDSQRGAPAPEGGTEKMVEMWSPDEVSSHYAEKHELQRLEKYKGEVKARIEQREQAIQLALQEGRIL